jgi:hypothetical protein
MHQYAGDFGHQGPITFHNHLCMTEQGRHEFLMLYFYKKTEQRQAELFLYNYCEDTIHKSIIRKPRYPFSKKKKIRYKKIDTKLGPLPPRHIQMTYDPLCPSHPNDL